MIRAGEALPVKVLPAHFYKKNTINDMFSTQTKVFLLLLLCNARLGAQQWEQVAGLPSALVASLSVYGDTLFAGGFNRVYVSQDGGNTWDSTAVVSPDIDEVNSVRYAQGRLWAGTPAWGIFRSDDGGQHWQADNNGLSGLGAMQISSLALRGDSLYAGTYGAGVFVKKISSNSNWSAYNAGIPWLNVESLNCVGDVLFAGAGMNATVSMQRRPGNAWVEVNYAVFSGLGDAFLGVTEKDGVLLAAGSLGLYRSTDGGDNWAPYNAGTGYLERARLITGDGKVFANLVRTSGLSFLKYSDDLGQHWQDVQPPLGGSIGYDIAWYNGVLYAARSNGLWRLVTPTGIETPVASPPSLQITPNPVSEFAFISFTLQRPGRIALEVFDAAGMPVSTIWQGEAGAGLQEFRFEAGTLPPGLYICRLTTGPDSVTQSMLLVR